MLFFLIAGPGQAVDVALAKFQSIAHGRHRVHLPPRAHRQQLAVAHQIQVLVGVAGNRVTVVSGQAGHPRRADVLPTGIGDHGRKAILIERLADGSRHRVGADDEEAARGRFRHFQQARQRPRGQTLQRHGANDYRERQRHQQLGAFHAVTFQPLREQRGNRRGDNATRRDPGEQRFLPPVEFAAESGHPDRQRPGHQLHHQQHHQGGAAQLRQLGHVQAGGKDDEQHRNQHHRQILLEVEDIVGTHALEVGQHDTGGGDRHQPGFLAKPVGQHELAHHHGQHQEAAQVFRHQVTLEQEGQHERHHGADHHAQHHGLGEQPQAVQQGTLAGGRHQLIGQYHQNGAKRVDDDALPAQ